MENVYWEYYHPNKDELKKMKTEAVFVFDASSLLGIYSLPQHKIDSLFKVLDSLSKNQRIWMAHQFGEEYHRHRKQKIAEQFEHYENATKSLDRFADNAKSQIIPEFKEHRTIDKEKIKKRITALISAIKSEIQNKKQSHPDWRENDPICVALETVFKDSLGEKYKDSEYPAKLIEVEDRIKQKKQPGLSDAKNSLAKDKLNGDALAWLQIIDYISNTKRPVILVTEETKADFWEEKRVSDMIFPRRALIREMYDKTGQLFFILNMENFSEFIQNKDYIPTYPPTLGGIIETETASTEVVGSENTEQLTDKKS